MTHEPDSALAYASQIQANQTQGLWSPGNLECYPMFAQGQTELESQPTPPKPLYRKILDWLSISEEEAEETQVW